MSETQPFQNPEAAPMLGMSEGASICQKLLAKSMEALAADAGLLPRDIAMGAVVGILDRAGRRVNLPATREYPVPTPAFGEPVAFRSDEIDAARWTLFQMVQQFEPGTLKISLFNGTATDAFRDLVASLGPLATQCPDATPEGQRRMLDELWRYQVAQSTGQHALGTVAAPPPYSGYH